MRLTAPPHSDKQTGIPDIPRHRTTKSRARKVAHSPHFHAPHCSTPLGQTNRHTRPAIQNYKKQSKEGSAFVTLPCASPLYPTRTNKPAAPTLPDTELQIAKRKMQQPPPLPRFLTSFTPEPPHVCAPLPTNLRTFALFSTEEGSFYSMGTERCSHTIKSLLRCHPSFCTEVSEKSL